MQVFISMKQKQWPKYLFFILAQLTVFSRSQTCLGTHLMPEDRLP